VSRLRKACGVIGAASVVVLLAAGSAAAHVTVNPSTATGGSYGQLTFRAPNEEAKANFTKLTIHLPAAHPLGSVSTRPLPGWKVTTTIAKLAKPITTDDGTVTQYTDSITWIATDGGVGPDQFQNFDVSVGPLPDGGTMSFSAEQTYDDGTVVKWDEPTSPGAAEPEHPAPVVTLTPASSSTTAAADGGEVTRGSTSDGVARGLAIAAIVLAVLAIASGWLTRRRAT
jgi:periplasmic copper chaperone A